MVTYSYIPPEYKTPAKTPYTPSPLSQCTTVQPESRGHNIPYRDTGALGKHIFGKPPTWKFKPLPPFTFENVAAEQEDDSMTTQVGDESEVGSETKKEGKITKVVKNFSRKFSAAVSKK